MDSWKASTDARKKELDRMKNWPFPVAIGGLPGKAPDSVKVNMANGSSVDFIGAVHKGEAITGTKFDEMINHFGESPV